MSFNRSIHRLLYRTLSLDGYLKCVSGMFFLLFDLGIGRKSRATEYAHHLRKLIKEGDTVIDIGANLGYYSRCLSKCVGRGGKVWAVEPVEPVLNVLRHNLRHCKNVEICNCALGAEECTIRMVNDTARRNGFLGTGQNRVEQNPTKKTDQNDLCFEAQMKRGSKLFSGLERIDFIKCDIEGFEVVVMTEMLPLLERFHPMVLIETGDENRPKIVELFSGLGYRGFTLLNGREVELVPQSDKDIIFRYLK